VATIMLSRSEQVLRLMRDQLPGTRFNVNDIGAALGITGNNASMVCAKIKMKKLAPIVSHGKGEWSLQPFGPPAEPAENTPAAVTGQDKPGAEAAEPAEMTVANMTAVGRDWEGNMVMVDRDTRRAYRLVAL
jgi:hypothetical protein